MTDKEKQYVEIAQTVIADEDVADALTLLFAKIAETLHNAGYRKQRESEENIEQIFNRIMDFIYDREAAVDILAERSDNDEYYAGCADAYCRVGGYIIELRKEYMKGGEGK